MPGKPTKRKAKATPLLLFKDARGVVVRVRVAVAMEFPGVSVVGFNVHVEPAGAPEQVSVINEGKPPVPGVRVIEEVAGLPATNDKLAGVALIEKSTTETATGVTVVDGLNVISPEYAADNVWEPVVRVLTAKVAVPLIRVAVPRVATPSERVTLPVGVPPLPLTVVVIVAAVPGNS